MNFGMMFHKGVSNIDKFDVKFYMISPLWEKVWGQEISALGAAVKCLSIHGPGVLLLPWVKYAREITKIIGPITTLNVYPLRQRRVGIGNAGAWDFGWDY